MFDKLFGKLMGRTREKDNQVEQTQTIKEKEELLEKEDGDIVFEDRTGKRYYVDADDFNTFCYCMGQKDLHLVMD